MSGNSNYGRSDFSAFAESLAREAEEKAAEEQKRRHAARLTGVHTTCPIKSVDMQARWLEIAKEHDREKREGGVSWYMLLLLGFHSGLRIGDMCKLRVKDVRGQERICVVAKKTEKQTNIKLKQSARKAFDAALKDMDPEDYVLGSRQKSRKDGGCQPITRQRCYAIIKEIARRACFDGHVGCHTMRKTFAWNFYQTHHNIGALQYVLNHSSQAATMHYIGVDQEEVDRTLDESPTPV